MAGDDLVVRSGDHRYGRAHFIEPVYQAADKAAALQLQECLGPTHSSRRARGHDETV